MLKWWMLWWRIDGNTFWSHPVMQIFKKFTENLVLCPAWYNMWKAPDITYGMGIIYLIQWKFSFCSHPDFVTVIAIRFYTWHSIRAVMACAKFCSNLMAKNSITAKLTFRWSWITRQKSSIKWALGSFQVDIICPVMNHASCIHLDAFWYHM